MTKLQFFESLGIDTDDELASKMATIVYDCCVEVSEDLIKEFGVRPLQERAAAGVLQATAATSSTYQLAGLIPAAKAIDITGKYLATTILNPAAFAGSGIVALLDLIGTLLEGLKNGEVDVFDPYDASERAARLKNLNQKLGNEPLSSAEQEEMTADGVTLIQYTPSSIKEKYNITADSENPNIWDDTTFVSGPKEGQTKTKADLQDEYDKIKLLDKHLKEVDALNAQAAAAAAGALAKANRWVDKGNKAKEAAMGNLSGADNYIANKVRKCVDEKLMDLL